MCSPLLENEGLKVEQRDTEVRTGAFAYQHDPSDVRYFLAELRCSLLIGENVRIPYAAMNRENFCLLIPISWEALQRQSKFITCQQQGFASFPDGLFERSASRVERPAHQVNPIFCGSPNPQSRTLPGICPVEFHCKEAIGPPSLSEVASAWHDPCPAGCDCGISRFFSCIGGLSSQLVRLQHRAPLPICDDAIEDDSRQGKSFQSELPPLYPTLFAIAGFATICCGLGFTKFSPRWVIGCVSL